ncbi:MAG: M48 family metalloprotease [Hyphomonadaceae bacterium]
MAASGLSELGRAATRTVAALTALALASAETAHAQRQERAPALIRDAEIEDTLRAYTNPLLVAAGLQPGDVDLYIVQDPSINAFVAGGQNIFMHTGLVLEAQNPNEIIGVMAHETGHIAGGHGPGRAQDIQRAMGPMLISIGLGVLAIAAGAPQAGAALISGSQAFAMGDIVRHTQTQEASADQAALQYLEATGQSGRGLITFFDREMRPYEFQARRAPPWLMTHPFTSDRVEALRAAVTAASHHDASETDDNMRRFRMMQAKLYGFIESEGRTLARYPLRDQSQPARYARAIAYFRASKRTEARAELQTLIDEEPGNPYFQELMGQILFETGQTAESIPYHRRSLELAPGQPLLQINLARALIESGGRPNIDEAIRLLRQAAAQEPNNGYAWREMARAYGERGDESLAELASAEQSFSVGDYSLALNFAERARRGLPRNTTDYQRANDIVNFASIEVREQMERRGRRS